MTRPRVTQGDPAETHFPRGTGSASSTNLCPLCVVHHSALWAVRGRSLPPRAWTSPRPACGRPFGAQPDGCGRRARRVRTCPPPPPSIEAAGFPNSPGRHPSASRPKAGARLGVQPSQGAQPRGARGSMPPPWSRPSGGRDAGGIAPKGRWPAPWGAYFHRRWPTTLLAKSSGFRLEQSPGGLRPPATPREESLAWHHLGTNRCQSARRHR